MSTYHTRRRCIAGQGMTEYIIVVTLIAIAAIGVYSAFGEVVRGQTIVAASALSGKSAGTGRTFVDESRSRAESKNTPTNLANYDK